MVTPLAPRHAHALLHFTVFLWGMTAILGKTIHIGALPLVFYRVLMVTGMMALLLRAKGESFRVPQRRAIELVLAGALVAVHWVLFYAAIKVAGVTASVLCLSSISFFTALLEPVFFKRTPRARELLIGALVVVGVVLLLDAEAHAKPAGIALGMASAVASAAFGAWNGRLAQHDPPARVTFYELGAATVVCAMGFPLLGGFIAPWHVTSHDWARLTFLAVVCTALPWLWTLRILRTLSPFTLALSVALEPVYSIVFAFMLWPNEERLSARFYAGAITLFGLVTANALSRHAKAHSRDAHATRG